VMIRLNDRADFLRVFRENSKKETEGNTDKIHEVE